MISSSDTIATILKSIPLFQHLSDISIDYIACHAECFEYQDNHTIFQKGDEPDHMYILHDGLIEIYSESEYYGNHRISMISDGELFGEVGIISNSKRNGSARTISKASGIKIKQSAILHLLQLKDQCMVEFLHIICNDMANKIFLSLKNTSRAHQIIPCISTSDTNHFQQPDQKLLQKIQKTLTLFDLYDPNDKIHHHEINVATLEKGATVHLPINTEFIYIITQGIIQGRLQFSDRNLSLIFGIGDPLNLVDSAFKPLEEITYTCKEKTTLVKVAINDFDSMQFYLYAIRCLENLIQQVNRRLYVFNDDKIIFK